MTWWKFFDFKTMGECRNCSNIESIAIETIGIESGVFERSITLYLHRFAN